MGAEKDLTLAVLPKMLNLNHEETIRARLKVIRWPRVFKNANVKKDQKRLENCPRLKGLMRHDN